MTTWAEVEARIKAGQRKYPWEVWMNGDPHNLTPGVSFSCSVESFRAQAHKNARDNNHKVRTWKHPDGSVTIMAVER